MEKEKVWPDCILCHEINRLASVSPYCGKCLDKKEREGNRKRTLV